MSPNVLKDIINNISQNGLYDILKFLFMFVLYKIFEHFYLKKLWGGWFIRLYEDAHQCQTLKTERKLSLASAQRIINDEGELSVYVKGVISPYAHINIDIASPKAQEVGLIKIDKKRKLIIIDLSKNPKESEKEVY